MNKAFVREPDHDVRHCPFCKSFGNRSRQLLWRGWQPWTPNEPGLQFRPVPKSPAVAADPKMRLRYSPTMP